VTKVEEEKPAPTTAKKTAGEAKPAAKRPEQPRRRLAKQDGRSDQEEGQGAEVGETAGATKKKAGEPKAAAKKAGATKKRPVRRLESFERKSMGQKVHPYGFRLGVNKPWRSRWFSERDYSKLLVEDVKLKAELREKLKAAGVSSVEIERPGTSCAF